jgi:hypothetical protein
VAVDVDVRETQDAPEPRPVRPRRPVLLVAGALVAAWLVPLLTHLLGLDIVLPVLIWLAVASLLRAGRTVLDRLVIALGMLLGAVPVAGLVISYWPWGLQPVPLAGFALSGLVGIAVLLRRRPALPIALRAADLVTVGLGLLSFAAVFWPYRHADRAQRFALIAAGGDYANHFTIYDMIRGIGGYPFLHPGRTRVALWDILVSYPQGLHMTAGVLTSFIRSDGTQAASALTELDTFVWYEPATFVFMCLAVAWALRWLTGPTLRAWVMVPIGVLGLCYLLFGDLITLLWLGYWAEVAALGEFAILIAVLARPLPRVREQVTLVTALTVAICYTYFLMLPTLAVILVCWLWIYRRRLRGHWRFTALVGGAGALAGGLMVVINAVAMPVGAHVAAGGTILYPDKRNLLTFTLLAFALAVGAARRSVVWRIYLVAQLGTLALVAGIAAYQEAKQGYLQYYFWKAEHILIVVDVLGLGAGATLLSRVIGRVGVRDWFRPDVLGRAAVPSLALSLAAVTALGPFLSDTFARQYEQGKQAWRWPVTVAFGVVQRIPAGTGDVVAVWPGPNAGVPPHATHWSNVLLRDHGHGALAAAYVVDQAQFEKLFAATPYRVWVVTDNQKVVDEVGAILDRRPEFKSRVQVVVMPMPARWP